MPQPPPLYIRQQPISYDNRPKTAIYRQNPPKMPPIIPSETITIPGRVLPPPPRQVIVERLPQQPEQPPNIIIEKWLDYEPQQRRVLYLPPEKVVQQNIQPAKNVLIQWETPNVQIKKEYKDLGYEVVDPYEYAQKYGLQMVDTNQNQVELTGDLHALKYVDLDQLNIKKKNEVYKSEYNKVINTF